MGFIKKIFGVKKPADPVELKEPIPPTQVPNLGITGGYTGISNDPAYGTQVGIYGLDKLRQIYNQTQNQLGNILPNLGNLSPEDLSSGQKIADTLYDRGRKDLESSLYNNVANFRDDSFRRGMGASSSFLSGINSLLGSNSNALANLRSESDLQGLKYAWDLANMRNKAAGLLNSFNSDIYGQINQFPLELGLDYALSQAKLSDQNKALNADRLYNYYRLKNQGTRDYNRSLVNLYSSEASNASRMLPYFIGA